ncbi:right-handed parallel beta-helix repeat-containing protein [Sneathiella sp.]|uniref:right-handed parallel beta-helix repeat-containing protein n=1 Tax=Sneathiella sp. TaxID=1964365 RepID=UPI003569260D
MAINTILVSNSAELTAALKGASGGETILLESGNYNDFSFSGGHFNSEVTIKSADLDDMADFRTIRLSNVSNLTVDSVNLDFVPDSGTVSSSSAFYVGNSSNVTLQNSTLEGRIATSGDGGPSGIIEGYPVGRAITAINSDDITIENNDISVFHKGIIPANIDGLNIIDNEIYDLRTSPVTGGDVRDVNIEGNYFHSSQPWAYGGAGDHGDYIHFWITATQTEASDNIHISDNHFAEGTGQSMLGIYLDNNGDMNGLQFEDVVIDNNVFSTGNHQGIRIEGAQGLEITNNSLIQISGDSKDGPTVVLAYGVKDAAIADNILSMPIAEAAGSEHNSNIVEHGNILVQYTDPNGDNYIGDLFVNALQDNPTLSDLLAVPDGVLEQLGVGSTLTYDISGNHDSSNSGGGTPVVDVPVVDEPVDETPVIDTPVVDTPVVDEPVDETPVVDAPVVDEPVDETPVVDTPVVDEPLGQLTEAEENEALHQSANNVGDDLINLGRGDEYFGSDDFTASITFALDGLDDGRQRLLWNHSNYGVQVVNDDLVIYFAEEGEKMNVFQFRDVIKDTDWHDVQLVLDDSSDTFSVYFDGNVLEQLDGVTGGIKDAQCWDMTVGGTLFSSADDFKGEIADFSIIDHAMDIDASQTVYERTVAIDAMDQHNGSSLDVIGIAAHGQDALDFS